VSSLVVSRIAGFAGAVLLGALAYLGVTYTTSPPAGSYEVTVVLGDRAGQGVGAGTDVKARGVVVGEVKSVSLDQNARPIAVLTIFPDQPLPNADRIHVEIGSKTFLGPKQVELHFDGAVDEPYLASGDTLRVADGRGPREPVDMFDAFADVFEAIPGERLGELYEAFGTFTMEDAEIAGRNIELSDEMFRFHARTADLQVENLTALADILEEFAPRTDDINRLTATVPIWASLLPDRQADFRRNFESLSRFAEGFAEFLEVNEDDLSELINLGRQVLLMLEPRLDQVGEMINGLAGYSGLFLRHAGTLSDGSQWGWIRVMFPAFEELCHRAPEDFQEGMEDIIPGCPRQPGGPDYASPENDDDDEEEDEDEEGLP
jgi:virulence factor Mce-like protein